MLRKIALGLSALVGVLFLGGAIVYLATNPSQPPEGSVAAELLKPGAFEWRAPWASRVEPVQ